MLELPAVSLGVIHNNMDELLLVERISKEILEDGTELSWALPGGKQEPSETSAQAVVREIREETGLEVIANHLIFYGRHPVAPINVSYWACGLVHGAEQHHANDEAINRCAWIAVSGLSHYLTSALHPAVEDYLR